MAKVTIQTHNLSATNSSGSVTLSVNYSECTGVSATVKESSVSGFVSNTYLTAQGNLVIFWYANTSKAQRSAIIEITASVSGGGTVKDAVALNQKGTEYETTISGSRDIEGQEGAGTYQITTSVGNTKYSATTEGDWLTLQTLTKTAPNKGNMVLSWTRNTSEPRYGIVKFVAETNLEPYRTFYYMVITQGVYVQQASQLYYSPNTASVGYNAGTYTTEPPVLENVSGLSVRNVSGSMDIASVDIDRTSGRLVIVYGANTGSTDLDCSISVTGTGVNGTVQASFQLFQGSYKYVVNPIWKTTTVEVAGKSYVDYTITTEGVTVYSGRAYQMPGEDSINFELNDIVRDYIDNTLWWREGYQTPSGWARSFTLEMSDGSGGDYVFTKDWSYKEMNYDSTPVICLNDPIINEVPVGCLVPVCIFSPQRAGNAYFIRRAASTAVVYTANLDNPRQARYLFVAQDGMGYGYVADSQKLIYKGTADCKTRYVLYYENAFGGIDAIPIQGNSLATDKITSYTFKNPVRVPSRDFSYRRYLNDISKTWKLNTAYLSDEQAGKMHHLLESTMVYLYDIQEASLTPVVIDDSSVEYKTFKNQGRKFFNYTFNVKESQSKIRK